MFVVKNTLLITREVRLVATGALFFVSFTIDHYYALKYHVVTTAYFRRNRMCRGLPVHSYLYFYNKTTVSLCKRKDNS